jgi:predicted small secreted protein
LEPEKMNTQIRKNLIVLLIGGFVLTLVACNTIKGVGKDTEVAGEVIQKEADRHIDKD